MPALTPRALSPRALAAHRRPLLLGLLGLVLLVVAALGALVAVQQDEALPGVRVGVVDVGGLGEDDLRGALQERLAPTYDRPLVVRAAGVAREVVPAEVGARLDLDATADRALDAGHRDPLARLASLVGRERGVDPVAALDDAALAARVEALAAEVAAAPDPGRLEVDPASLAVTEVPPTPGRALEVDAATALLADALRGGAPGPVELPVTETPPPTTAAQVSAAAATARTVLAGPFSLTSGATTVQVPAADLARLLRAEPGDAGVALGVDREAAAAVLDPLLDDVRQAPVAATIALPAPTPLLTAQGDASFAAQPAAAGAVTPATAGVAVDTAATVEALAAAVATGARTAVLPLTEAPPAVTAEQLAQVDQVIGSFTTSYPCCRPRAQNIARIAELVDGTVVAPGAEFSLNRTAGERTRSRGFVADGAIVDGELVDEVGGGVSQFSTTLYNAVWFAGLDVLEHQPHSRYISRYPPGREATLYFGAIDNRFRNDTGAPVVVRTSTDGSSVTVTLYGHTGDRVVRSDTGAQQPRSGGGFRVSYSRDVVDGGRVVSEDSETWTYDPPLD